MPRRFMQPGVYVHEVPASSGRIQGLPTSIAAFVGRTRRGPVATPVEIVSIADYRRTFGAGSDAPSLEHDLEDYFLQGGERAVVVRVWEPDGAAPSSSDEATGAEWNGCARFLVRVGEDVLALRATSPGTWGDDLRLEVVPTGSRRAGDGGCFDLTVQLREDRVEIKETCEALSFADGSDMVRDRIRSTLTLVEPDPEKGPLPESMTPMKVAIVAPGSDGRAIGPEDLEGDPDEGTGLFALVPPVRFNLLVLQGPMSEGAASRSLLQAAVSHCARHHAFLLVDPPEAWTLKEAAEARARLGLDSPHAALNFPRLRGSKGHVRPPSPSVAGVIARTDRMRGVWKAPAGLEASVHGFEPVIEVRDDDQNVLANGGVNPIRTFPSAGTVVWGTRTTSTNPEWRYISVRRLLSHIASSFEEGLQWTVFEANGERLWAKIRLEAEAFLHTLFRQGAFRGSDVRESFFVRCDRTTTPASDTNVATLQYGVAVLVPSEFMISTLRLRTAE